MNVKLPVTAALAITGVFWLGLLATARAEDKEVVGAEVARPPGALAEVAAPDGAQPEVRAAGPAATSQGPADEANRLIQQEIGIQQVRWERTKAAVHDNMARADRQLLKPEDDLAPEDFVEARNRIDQAMHILASNQDVAVAAEYTELTGELDRRKAQINHKQEEWNAKKVAQERDAARDRQLNEARQARERLQARVDELMNQVLASRQERDYAAAIRNLQEVLKLDPSNRQARTLLDDSQTLNIIYTQRKIDDRQSVEKREALLGVREALTTYDKPINYPDGDVWRELTERRLAYKAGMPPETPANQRVRDQMQKNVSEIRFQAITFENALNFLRDLQRVNINPNWGAMEAMGITKATEVSLQLRDVTFETALRELLSKVAGKEDVLDYMVRDGVIKISSKDDLATQTYILVYDVRDLIHPLLDFRAPVITQNQQNQQQQGGQGGATQRQRGGGLFGTGDTSSTGDNAAAEKMAAETRGQMLAKFLELLRGTVVPESWAPTGPADIKENGDGLLVVKQTANGHRKMVEVLSQLREHSRIEVCIEVRFLQVESDYLEDIGLDLDFIFNLDHNHHFGNIPVSVGQFGKDAADPITGLFPATGTQFNAIGSSDIFTVSRSSLVASGSFLDDIQVDFFLRATEAHHQEGHLDSARITLLNGHEGYVRSGVSTDYVTITNFGNTSGTSGTQNGLGIAQFMSGVIFGVRATVTADRRYVIMTVWPNRMKDSIAGTRTMDFVNVIDTGTTGGAIGGVVTVSTATIDLIQSIGEEVRSTVMVPDQGTLLLGGERIADELEIETGVPILSKIPVVKRAFTQRTFVKREKTTLVLIRPQILIPEELEPASATGM